jgi:hypothetical protein
MPIPFSELSTTGKGPHPDSGDCSERTGSPQHGHKPAQPETQAQSRPLKQISTNQSPCEQKNEPRFWLVGDLEVIPRKFGYREIANSLTEQCGHKTFQISGFWADYFSLLIHLRVISTAHGMQIINFLVADGLANLFTAGFFARATYWD